MACVGQVRCVQPLRVQTAHQHATYVPNLTSMRAFILIIEYVHLQERAENSCNERVRGKCVQQMHVAGVCDTAVNA